MNLDYYKERNRRIREEQARRKKIQEKNKSYKGSDISHDNGIGVIADSYSISDYSSGSSDDGGGSSGGD
jgi:hypothetical protein